MEHVVSRSPDLSVSPGSATTRFDNMSGISTRMALIRVQPVLLHALCNALLEPFAVPSRMHVLPHTLLPRELQILPEKEICFAKQAPSTVLLDCLSHAHIVLHIKLSSSAALELLAPTLPGTDLHMAQMQVLRSFQCASLDNTLTGPIMFSLSLFHDHHRVPYDHHVMEPPRMICSSVGAQDVSPPKDRCASSVAYFS